MPEPFVQEETVRWSDVDAMGVLNNAVFLTFFEQARFGYFRTLPAMRGDWFPFVLGSTNVRFVRPGRAGMRVQVLARVVRLGTKSFDMDYIARSGSDTLATASATLVWVDHNLQSVVIPSAVRAEIAAREGIAAGP